jgi:hypothetical protein
MRADLSIADTSYEAAQRPKVSARCHKRSKAEPLTAGLPANLTSGGRLVPTTIPHAGRSSSTRVAPICETAPSSCWPGRTTANTPLDALGRLLAGAGQDLVGPTVSVTVRDRAGRVRPLPSTMRPRAARPGWRSATRRSAACARGPRSEPCEPAVGPCPGGRGTSAPARCQADSAARAMRVPLPRCEDACFPPC